MSHIFISYSKQDIQFARYLKRLLETEGFGVWMDETGLVPSERWWPTIERNIDTCAAFVVIMSSHSKESTWVEREILRAEKKKKPIFPVLLEGEEWSRLADVQYADMRAGLEATLPVRLLEGLTAVVPVHSPQPVPEPLPGDLIAHAGAAPGLADLEPAAPEFDVHFAGVERHRPIEIEREDLKRQRPEWEAAAFSGPAPATALSMAAPESLPVPIRRPLTVTVGGRVMALAGSTERLVAGFIDLLIIFVLSVIFVYSIDPNLNENMSGLFFVLVGIPYHWFFLALNHGQTPGKKLLGLQVVKADGGPLTSADARNRTLVYFLGYLPLYMGLIWILFDPSRQGWHDKVAKTYVIKVQ